VLGSGHTVFVLVLKPTDIRDMYEHRIVVSIAVHSVVTAVRVRVITNQAVSCKEVVTVKSMTLLDVGSTVSIGNSFWFTHDCSTSINKCVNFIGF